ncbi:RNA polymerase sigma factor [Sporosarcina thermotolerans]|uniref:RNA polymerase sigma factor n=1 Tax=Sporosarcina thermotolerans TaxID=633404 RepID=A0AAW9A5P9_9BACL|nr:RNA polymerase sigma factor [Sporosarcina thermotolerans]MDW0116562.1 RNA polymerase sigma factor [Sporosarcina thermotolerans]WHT48784.1 RNA polymerase sigma factor [Sporosarcina thermotolerans]
MPMKHDELGPNNTPIEEICRTTWEPLYRFIYYKVQNREEAQEITQETYIKAIPYFRKGRIESAKYLSFLKTIALNLIRDSWRKKQRRGTTIELDAIQPLEAAVDDETSLSDQRFLIEKALGQLNEEQRTVIELRILKGYSTAETAKIMDKNDGNIRVMQHRALQALASILKKMNENGGMRNER